MELDLGKVVDVLNSGASPAPAPGAVSEPAQPAADALPQGDPSVNPDGGAKPAAPAPETTPEPVAITSKSIVKEGDVFVYRGPEIKDERGNVVGQTIYTGATVDDVIEQMAKGKSEADLAIARLRKGNLVGAGKRIRPHKVSSAEPEPEPDQSDDDDLPTAPPDMREIQEKILREEIRNTGIDPKYLSYTKEDWRALAEAGEVPVFEIMELKDQQKETLARTKERSNAIYQQRTTEHGNTILIRRESDQLAEHIVEEGLVITEEQYQDLLEEHLSQRSSYINGVVIPGKLFRTVLKQIKEVAKKNANGKPAAPAASAARPTGDPHRQTVAPGVKTSKAGQPAGAPSQHQPRNLQESEKGALEFLISHQQKK